MKPLEEYMLFTKTDAEKIFVLNSSGMRSAQCNAKFDTMHQKLVDEPTLNTSIGECEKCFVKKCENLFFQNF